MAKKRATRKTIYPALRPGQEFFSTFDTARILKLKRERLRQWANFGFIPAGTKVAWGQGYKMVWSKFSLYSISLFRKLVDAGLKRKAAAKCLGYVEWEFLNPPGPRYLLFADGPEEPTVVKLGDADSLRMLADAEIRVFIDLQKIKDGVDSAV